MFLTLTANAALDRVIFIEEFVPATTMRAPRFIECAGGKGFDTSVALRGLGQPTTAIGFAQARPAYCQAKRGWLTLLLRRRAPVTATS